MKSNMKSTFHIVLSMMFVVLLTSSAKAQLNWSTLSTQPTNPSTVSYVTSGTGTVATLTNYIAWTTLVYSYPTAPSVGNGTMQLGFVGDFSGKIIYVSIVDATGKFTTMDVNALLTIPYSASITSSTPTQNYSIDLNLLNKQTGLSLSSIAKINFIIYTDVNATTSPTLPANSHILIATPIFGAGTTGVSTVLNPTLNQEWALESNGYIFNSNNRGVIVGSPTSNNVTGLLSYPYYNFVVNGRTNFIGNDNAIGVWSATTGSTGFRHYLGVTNATFPSTTTEYSTINAYEWNSSNNSGNPKHLTLQNYNDPNKTGNIGIGYYTAPPVEKLSVNGNILLSSADTYFTGLQRNLKLSTEFFANTVHTPYSMINSFESNPSNNTITGYTSIILQNNQSISNVGIGYHIAPPVEKLSVNGNIRCKQLIGTQQGWADYVFTSDYKLKSLSEVKNYIIREGHLPNIPSEKEISADGPK